MNIFIEILNESHINKSIKYWKNQGYDLTLRKRKYSKKYKFLGIINDSLNYYSASELINLKGKYEIISQKDICINQTYKVKGCEPHYQYVGNVKLNSKTAPYFKERLVIARYKGGVIVSLDSSDLPTLVFYKYGYSKKKYSLFEKKHNENVEKYGYFNLE